MTQKTRAFTMAKKASATVSTYNNTHSLNIGSTEHRVDFLKGPQNVYDFGNFYKRAYGNVFEVDNEGTCHLIGRICVPVTDEGKACPNEIEAHLRDALNSDPAFRSATQYKGN